MQNLKEAFGGNLRRIRKSKKLTIENFSEMLEITPRQLTKIESGDTFLTADTLCKISISLDISLQSLFDFEWDDNLMYFDKNKHIKTHFKVTKINDTVKIKSFPSLKDKVNQIIPADKLDLFLTNFAKTKNITIYVDFFINKDRIKIIKVKPDGTFSFLISRDEIKVKTMNTKDDNYYYVIEKIKEFSEDKTKIEYIKTAMDALNNKKSLEKLKAMIKGIEISI